MDDIATLGGKLFLAFEGHLIINYFTNVWSLFGGMGYTGRIIVKWSRLEAKHVVMLGEMMMGNLEL